MENTNKPKRHTIWTDDLDEIAAIAADMKAADPMRYGGMSEEDLFIEASEINCEYLDDARLNLSGIPCNTILAVGDLGLWNGRRRGYQEIPVGPDALARCLYSDCDYNTWYVEDDEFKATMAHHDGTNYVVYRERRSGVSDEQWDALTTAIWEGDPAADALLEQYTQPLGPKIAAVYGWEL